MLYHSGSRNFTCDTCGNKFYQLEHLKRHLSSLHNIILQTESKSIKNKDESQQKISKKDLKLNKFKNSTNKFIDGSNKKHKLTKTKQNESKKTSSNEKKIKIKNLNISNSKQSSLQSRNNNHSVRINPLIFKRNDIIIPSHLKQQYEKEMSLMEVDNLNIPTTEINEDTFVDSIISEMHQNNQQLT
jgi:hypothetical protein